MQHTMVAMRSSLVLASALASVSAQLGVQVGSPSSALYNVTVDGRTWLPSAGG
jgi:hypothetical protein